MHVRHLLVAGFFASAALLAGQSGPAPAREIQTVVRASTNAAVSQYLVAIPHFAFGGTWRTQFVITNTSSASADVTLNYFGDNGSPLGLPFSGVSTNSSTVTVPGNGQVVIEPDYQGSSSVGGWAGVVYTNSGVKIQGIFLWHNPSTPAGQYLQATAPMINQSGAACIVPLPGPASSYTMPFDETGGMFSGYGFANTTASAVTMTLTFYDQNGQSVGQYSEQLAGFGHDQFLVRDKVTGALGKSGTMVVGGQGVVPLGFRFNPDYTFTTWLP